MPFQSRSEETCERILDAAQNCFAELGYDAASTSAICQQAGVSKGAFYHHFPSKQAAYLALMDRWLESLDVRIASAELDSPSVSASLQSMVTALEPVFQGETEQAPFFLEFWSKAARNPEIREAAIAPYYRYREFFSGLIKAGIDDGNLPNIDPEMTANVLVSLAVGVLIQTMLDPDGADWSKVVQQGITLFLNGLLPSVDTQN